MKIIQGFVGIPSLVDNAVNQVARFGELSQHAMSFTRDLRTYSDKTAFPQIEIHTLKAVDLADTDIAIPKNIVVQMLTVANWIYTQYNNSAIPANNSKATLENAIITEFNYTRRVSVNEIMSTDMPSKRLPDRITFDIDSGTDLYRITLWFNDSRLRAQYKYYHIEVIPPVDDINRLVGDLAEVAVSLKSVKVQALTNRLNQYNQRHKVTSILTHPLVWRDVENPKGALNTEWTLIIHGNAGSDTDAIKAAIRDYLEQNSDYDKWMEVFPELFSANEFLIVPFWDNLASLKVTYDDGQYATMITNGTLSIARAKYIPHSYRFGQDSETFLNLNITIGSVFYRTMMFMSIGNPANNNGMFNLMHIFPDYMAVSTESVDFARMSPKTQEWVLQLNRAMNLARIYDPNRGLPEGFTLANKGAREYLGFDYEGYTYYILTRVGYLREA